MIFYFSGTGNSLSVAQKIGRVINERLISIADEVNNKAKPNYNLQTDETVGFVYPVYAWRPPRMVFDFIRNMTLENYDKNYIFSVCTCGDDEGYTTKVLNKTLHNKRLKLKSGFTVPMPNNYIPAFDVDPIELQHKKFQNADITILDICQTIEKREDVFKINMGSLPYLKTFLINPMFQKFAINTKKFYTTDNCRECGLCEKVCNAYTIKAEKRPVWGKDCTLCLACIHRCPAEAIQYGRSTVKKGRYYNPSTQ